MGCQASTFRFPSRRSRRPEPRLFLSPPQNPWAPRTRSRQQQSVALPQWPSVQPLSPPKVYELEDKNSKTDANLPPQLVSVEDYNSPPVFDVSPDKAMGNKVTDQLKRAGLQSTNLIFAFDFTKSNEQRGARSFNGKSLHCIGAEQNPYEQAVLIIGKTLDHFDNDGMIRCFGFGDASTADQEVFSFYQDENACCIGFEEVIERYREVVPQLQLGAGPKSFAPVIEMAMTVVEQSGGQYHVLVILTDGEVTRGNDTALNQLSPLEKKTIEAIVKAREYPLSIVVVGVGDGPWDMIMKFEREIPLQAFDNFQFVNAADILSENMDSARKVEFASAALLHLPFQYNTTQKLGILGATRENAVSRIPLPPPCYSSGFVGSDQAPHVSDNYLCPVCLTNEKNMAFGCGHQTCCDCGPDLETCPICRSAIYLRIKLY